MHTSSFELGQERLRKLLDYENENVLSRFSDLFEVSSVEASEIFQETKKFLYICQLDGVFIPDDLLIIDEMWHNFILFTKSYQHFCDLYFGKYMHHLPASKKEKEMQAYQNFHCPEKARLTYTHKLEQLMSTVYDELGEKTVSKWFQEYPVKYSKQRIKDLRKV